MTTGIVAFLWKEERKKWRGESKTLLLNLSCPRDVFEPKSKVYKCYWPPQRSDWHKKRMFLPFRRTTCAISCLSMNLLACVPVLVYLIVYLILFLSPPRPHDVFKPKSDDHKVTGSKPVSANGLSTSQSLGSSSRKFRRWSYGTIEFVSWLPQKLFQSLVREPLSYSGLLWEKTVSQLLFFEEQCVQIVSLLWILQRMHLSYFRKIIIMILFFPLLRTRFLSRNQEVESLQFETSFWQKILFSDFPVLGVVRAKL